MPAKPKYVISVTTAEGEPVFSGGSDTLLLRSEGQHPALCVVVAESLSKWIPEAHVLGEVSTPPPTTVASERVEFFTAQHASIVKQIIAYEDTHPDDAPCLDGVPITVYGGLATIRLAEKGLHR